MKTLLLGLLSAVALCSLSFGQSFSSTGTDGGNAVTANMQVTGPAVMTLTGGTITIKVPLSYSCTDAGESPSPGWWAPVNLPITVSGFGTATFTTGSGGGGTSIVATENFTTGALWTYLSANDATITITAQNATGQWGHGAGTVSLTAGTGSFAWSWHHVAGNATAITAPDISQVEVTKAYTNSSAALQYVGMGQYTSASLSSGTFTGNLYQPVWLSPGQTWTFNLLVSASDTDFYGPTVADLTQQSKVSPFYSGSVENFTGVTYLSSSGSGQGYAEGTGLAALPTTGLTPSGTGGDGGYLGGFGISAAGPQPGSVGQPLQGVGLGGSSVTASGGGTNGGGGGGASDAGLVDNAAAINTGIAAAATSINAQLGAAATAIANQDAKDTNSVIAQMAAGASGGGSVTVSNVGGGSASSVASSADVQNIPANSASYASTSAAATYASGIAANYTTQAATDQATTTGLAAAAGATIEAGTLGTEESNVLAAVTPLPAASSYATSPHPTAITDSFVSRITGSTYDSNPLTSGLLGGVVSNSVMTSFIGWIYQLILWASVLWFLCRVANRVFEIIRTCMTAAPAPISYTAMFLADSEVAGTSVGTGFAIGIQVLAAGIFATAMLAAPVLVIAAFETKFGLTQWVTTLTTAATTAAGMPGLGNIMSYIVLILPVGTLFAIMVSNFVMETASVVQLVIVAFALRIMRL